MARGRSRSQARRQQAETPTSPASEESAATTTETPAITPTETQTAAQPKERKKMAGLNPVQLQGLLAKSKVKGSGETVLKEFLASGETSTEVDLTTGPLAGKTPEQASTTLRNAQKRVITDTSTGQTTLAIPEAGPVRIVTAAVDENGEPVKADKAHPATTVYLINTAALANEGDGE